MSPKDMFGNSPHKGISRAFPCDCGFCMFGWRRFSKDGQAKSPQAIILAVGLPFERVESTEEEKCKATITATVTWAVMWEP